MCDFPARQLLEEVHKMRGGLPPYEFSNPAHMTYAAGFIHAIDDLRAYHEDLTGCQCWDDALVELGYLPHPVRTPGGAR